MFAVIKTGGKQYRVAADDRFTVERIAGEAGDSVTFSEVLMVDSTVGAPFVAGASVAAEIVEQTRGPKVISFKKRRRQNSKRTRGHRQDLTLIRISEILTDGKQPSAKPAAAAATADKPKRTAAEPAAPARDDADAPAPGATSEPTAAAETADAPATPKAARKPKAEKAAKPAKE